MSIKLYSNKLFLQPVDQHYARKDFRKYEELNWGLDTSTESDNREMENCERLTVTKMLKAKWATGVAIHKFNSLCRLKILLGNDYVTPYERKLISNIRYCL
jgi:hypothetical protein